MRPKTQSAIDALHAQIAELVAEEKAHHDAKHPGEHSLLRSMAHTRIDWAARPPAERDSAKRYAVFPSIRDFVG